MALIRPSGTSIRTSEMYPKRQPSRTHITSLQCSWVNFNAVPSFLRFVKTYAVQKGDMYINFCIFCKVFVHDEKYLAVKPGIIYNNVLEKS